MSLAVEVQEGLVRPEQNNMKQYLDLLRHILDNGVDKPNRTGIDTRSVFGHQLRFDLSKGFPAMTTKKMAWKAVVSELLWFLEGSGDENKLAEILWGDKLIQDGLGRKPTIWTANAYSDYWKPKSKFAGDLGRVYGVQWRYWKKYVINNNPLSWEWPYTTQVYNVEYIDQIADIIHKLKNNPDDRRIILSAWNVAELDDMALPPCHLMAQFYVANGKLSCLFYMRSIDTFLGLPFNIASYALLTHMLAHVTNLEVGELIWAGGDTHIYHNHFDAVNEQLSREPLPLPKLWLNPDTKNIDNFTMDDIKLIDYQSHEAIKAVMAV